MRSSSGVELRVIVPSEDIVPSAKILDIGLRSSKDDKLQRIAALEYENELLRRAAFQIQLQLTRHGGACAAWLEAIAENSLLRK